jgi:hypothetical protein
MPIVNLNANFIKHHLQCPPGKTSIEFTSKDLPGFFVEVTAASPGVGSYRLRYKENGKTRYKSIGRTYEIDFADAKKKAKELKSMLALGQSIKGNDKSNDRQIQHASEGRVRFDETVRDRTPPHSIIHHRPAPGRVGTGDL